MGQMTQLPMAPGAFDASEISLLDDSNPRAVVNLVPNSVKEAIGDHSFEKPDLFGRDESELYKLLRENNKSPTPTDNRLRIKFWDEYDRCQASGTARMVMANVTAGVCSKEFFYKNYLMRAEKVAWLMCPPTGYMTKATEALEFGIEQLRDILEQPHVNLGRVDTKLGELKTKIVMMLDTRVKGAPMQRSMNLNVNTSDKAVAHAATASSEEELMRQLKELDRRNRQAQNIPVPVEAEILDVTGEGDK